MSKVFDIERFRVKPLPIDEELTYRIKCLENYKKWLQKDLNNVESEIVRVKKKLKDLDQEG